MQTGSETADGKSDEGSGGVDPQKEAAYWREQHSKQPYAKHGSYEQFEHAYKTGYNSFFKYPGQNFDDVEDDVALGYEEAKHVRRCHGTRWFPQSMRSGTGWVASQSARSQPRRARVALS